MIKLKFLLSILLLVGLTNTEDYVISIDDNSSYVEEVENEVLKKFDINLHHEQLLKHANGNHLYLRKYLEIPDAHVFINSDAFALRPVKMVNYTEQILSSFDNWNENFFIKNNFFSYFSFGKLYKNNEIEASRVVNFKSAIETFNSESDEMLSFNFEMPFFVREQVELPSVLNCQYLEDKLFTTQMELHVNLKEYTPTRVCDDDQILCVVKGNISMMMLNETYAQKLANLKSKLDKSTYKITEFLTPNLRAGECLYVPKGWHHALTSQRTWLYSITWEHQSDYFEPNKCENSTASKKLISYNFKKDEITKEELNKKVGLIQLTRNAFLENFKLDKNLTLVTLEWDETSESLVNEIFTSLDLNNDKLLSLDDLELLTEDSCNNAVQTITKCMEKLQKKFSEQMLTKRNILDELFSQIKNIEFDDEKETLVREKISEFLYNIPENLKELFKKENFDLEELLMNELDRAISSKRQRKDKPKLNEHHTTPKSTTQEKEQTFVEVDTEQIEDLDAEVTKKEEL